MPVDGNAVCGTQHASRDGQPVYVLAVLDHQASAAAPMA
jgi:hypothetical protein